MLISVKVVPKAKKVCVKKLSPGQYKVYLTKPPVDGAANEQLVEVLSEFFEVKKRDVILIKGSQSRNKIVEIKGIEK